MTTHDMGFQGIPTHSRESQECYNILGAKACQYVLGSKACQCVLRMPSGHACQGVPRKQKEAPSKNTRECQGIPRELSHANAQKGMPRHANTWQGVLGHANMCQGILGIIRQAKCQDIPIHASFKGMLVCSRHAKLPCMLGSTKETKRKHQVKIYGNE